MARSQKAQKEIAQEMSAGSQAAGQELVQSARKPGRPSTRTPERELEILERLANGESILKICQDAHMPNRSTITNWMMKDPEFLSKVMTAYSFNTLFMAEMAMDVIDGGEHSTGNVERDKAKLSYIKWLMSKYNRPLFGDKIEVHETSERVVINVQQEVSDLLKKDGQFRF